MVSPSFILDPRFKSDRLTFQTRTKGYGVVCTGFTFPILYNSGLNLGSWKLKNSETKVLCLTLRVSTQSGVKFCYDLNHSR